MTKWQKQQLMAKVEKCGSRSDPPNIDAVIHLSIVSLRDRRQGMLDKCRCPCLRGLSEWGGRSLNPYNEKAVDYYVLCYYFLFVCAATGEYVYMYLFTYSGS